MWIEMPRLNLGTWGVGGRDVRDPSFDAKSAVRFFQRSVESYGICGFDTAEMYADGYAEEILGEGLCRVPREKLFLTSKVWKTHLREDVVVRACEESLRRLKSDYLDLYLIHQVEDFVPLEETLCGMARLVERGLIRHVGVSNFSVTRLQKAIDLQIVPICVNQVHYSLAVREPEDSGLVDFCRLHEVLLTAWRPLRDLNFEDSALVKIAEKYPGSPRQVALGYLLFQKGVNLIVKTLNENHLHENLRALSMGLSAEDFAFLKEHYSMRMAYSPSVPLR